MRKKSGFRINTLAEQSSKAASMLANSGISLAAIDWCKNGFFVESDQRDFLVANDAFNQSLIYVQNPSSMLASVLLDPKPGETVLDLAAAPGGKTLHIVSLMNNDGKVSAVEPIRGRFFKLQSNLKRYSANIVRTYMTDGRTVGRKAPERFDKVLLDAPCSGEARIHRSDPKSWQHWKPRKIKEQARKQYGLIRSAFESLKPGGTLLYCTCSFAPEENEAVVHDFLSDHDSAELVPIEMPIENFQSGLTSWESKSFDPAIRNAIRVIPNALFDGFFLAKIAKG